MVLVVDGVGETVLDVGVGISARHVSRGSAGNITPGGCVAASLTTAAYTSHTRHGRLKRRAYG